MKLKERCKWAESHELFIPYHDNEWGKPCYDDFKLFEMLCLESAQSGLSWLTILKKRDNYRKAFHNFDFTKISKYDQKKVEELLNNEGIVRHRGKIEACINNAKKVIELRKEFASFSNYIWHFVDHKPILSGDQPSKTKLSEFISKDLKRRGFKFVGSTTCYSFMQACGLVNDHNKYCFRYKK